MYDVSAAFIRTSIPNDNVGHACAGATHLPRPFLAAIARRLEAVADMHATRSSFR